MSINDISLTSGMRSNLLSLQGTVDLLNRTQNRLATGKKVNTAIDNPVSFFSAQSLNSRASKIDSLKDAMGQAIQTINAADKGITAITSMIEQAKGIASSALSADNTGGTTTVSVKLNSVVTNTPEWQKVTIDAAIANNDTVTIKNVGSTGNDITFTVGTNWTKGADEKTAASNLADAITNNSALVAAGYKAEYQAGTGDVFITKAGDDFLAANIAKGGNAAHITLTDTPKDTSKDKITVGTKDLYAGYGLFDVSGDDTADAKALVDAINNDATIKAQGYSAAVSKDDSTKVIISRDGYDIGLAQVASTAPSMISAVVDAEATELTNLQDQYNALRTQIDALAADSGYKGKNLLGDDDLTVKFEGSSLTVAGFSATAADLGVTDAAWRTGGTNAIDADLIKLDDALDTLSQNSSTLSGSLSIITVRQDFSNNMINTLTEGSNKLTLADTNEEGANMLMLQTRQSLATTALSLSSQAAQSVLRLFQ